MELRVPAALPQHEQQTIGQSVRATNVNSLPLCKMLIVVAVTVVQQIMTECNGAVLEEARTVAITIVLNLVEQNGTRIHRRNLLY
jgi:glycerol uptake facilitator-like aquaporin